MVNETLSMFGKGGPDNFCTRFAWLVVNLGGGGLGQAEPMLHPTLGDADWPTFVTFSWRDKRFEQTDNALCTIIRVSH